MSEAGLSAVSGATNGAATGATPYRSRTNTGLDAATATQRRNVTQVRHATLTSNRTTSLASLSSSSTSLSVEQGSQNDRLALLVMLLIELLLGLDKDGEGEGQGSAAGLMGLLMLSALRPSGDRISYFESHSSQVSLKTTTTSATAIQATAYGRAPADALADPQAIGSNLDLKA